MRDMLRIQHAYLVSGKLGFRIRLVFVVRRVECGQCSLVGLANLLELLHVAASSSQVHLGDLELRTRHDHQ